MRNLIRKLPDSVLRIIGYGLISLLAILPFRTCDCRVWNYTALINNGYRLRFDLCMIPAAVWILTLLVHLGLQLYSAKDWIPWTVLLAILTIIVVKVPYHTKEDFWSGMHVFLGFIGFILLQMLLVKIMWLETKLRTFYIGALLLAWFVSLTYSSINGLAEIIFVIGLSISLTELCIARR